MISFVSAHNQLHTQFTINNILSDYTLEYKYDNTYSTLLDHPNYLEIYVYEGKLNVKEDSFAFITNSPVAFVQLGLNNTSLIFHRFEGNKKILYRILTALCYKSVVENTLPQVFTFADRNKFPFEYFNYVDLVTLDNFVDLNDMSKEPARNIFNDLFPN